MRNTATIRVLSSYRASKAPRFQRVGMLAKRLFDIFTSAAGLFMLSPLLALIAWQIKRDSPGPVFFRGERVGKDGKLFKILKFRTMREEPQSHQGPRLTAQDDARVTPFGSWLRRTKLNELPQLWNVLKGEMSLVGPRPEDPLFANTWPRDVRKEVLSVRPGITSPASVLYRDEESMLNGEQLVKTYLGEILPSKLRLDQLYVRHRSFWGDLDIIFWTLIALAPQMRHKEVTEPSLFAGPVSILMHRHVRWFFYDLLVTLVAIGLAGVFWRLLGPLHVGWRAALTMAYCFATLFSVINILLKINVIDWSRAAASDIMDLIPGLLITLMAALSINNLLPTQWLGIPDIDATSLKNIPGIVTPWGTRSLLPNAMIVLSAGLAFAGFVAVRYRSRLITGVATRWVNWRGASGRGLERVLIVGGGNTGQYAAWMLQNAKFANSLHVAGFVDDSLYMQDTRIHGLNVLGSREDIPELVKQLDIGIIIFAIHNISKKDRQQLIELCNRTTARVFDFPDIPNALRQISRSNRSGNGSKPVSIDDLSADYPIADNSFKSFKELESRLADLEQTAQSGDISKTLEQIRNLRKIMGEESTSKQFPYQIRAE